MDPASTNLRSVFEEVRRRPAICLSTGSSGAEPVRSMPDWVDRLHVLPVGPCEWWLLCEPAGGSEDETAGQFVVAAAAGRYMVDTYDPASGDCVARESAEGGPLVAGLAFTGRAVLVHVRRLP